MKIFWDSTQRAQTEHYCDKCCSLIRPGDRYKRWMWSPESGRWCVMKEHVDPPCPEEDVFIHEKIVEPVSLRYQIAVVAVLKVLRNGETVTEFEPKITLASEIECDEPHNIFSDESYEGDEPF